MAKKKKSTLSKARDKQRKAKHPGRRVSESGNVYYESRVNRADKNRKKKYKKGGVVKDLNKKVSLKQIVSGK